MSEAEVRNYIMILTCHVERDGKPYIWTYDNLNGIIYDEEHNIIGEHLTFDPIEFKPSYYPDQNSNKQQSDITKLMIMLGQKCNFKCQYCTESAHFVKGYDGTPDDVPEFINLLTKYKIKPKSIEIWGGEPLVYWKTCIVLIPALRRIWPKKRIKFKTNGSLLDDEKIKFLKKYNILVPVSDDLDNRGRGPAAESNAIKQYENYNRWMSDMGDNFKICAQTTPLNCDSYELLQIAKTHFPNIAKSSLYIEMLRVPYGLNASEFPFKFSDDNLRTIYHSSIKRLLHDRSPIQSDYAYSNYFYLFLKNHSYLSTDRFNVQHGRYIDSRCDSANGTRLQIDLKGNIFKCKLSGAESDKLGHISNMDAIDFSKAGYTSCLSRPYCPNCPVVALCRGICALTDNDALIESCRARYVYFYVYFKIAFEFLTGAKLIAIDTTVPTSYIVNFTEPLFDYSSFTKKTVNIKPV